MVGAGVGVILMRTAPIVVLVLLAFPASPHSGKTDPYGCHDRESPWYDRTIHFTPFNTMKECLDSGGRRPQS